MTSAERDEAPQTSASGGLRRSCGPDARSATRWSAVTRWGCSTRSFHTLLDLPRMSMVECANLGLDTSVYVCVRVCIMELSWYFEALAAVLAWAWLYSQIEAGKTWAVWMHTTYCNLWEKLWTALMRHLGPDSPYTRQPRHLKVST